jgi:hypothetical protein
VVDDVRAERIVASHLSGDEDLRADAVDGRSEDGVVVAGEGVESREAAGSPDDLRAMGSLDGRAHKVHGLLSAFDGDARGLVAAALIGAHPPLEVAS